VKSGLNSIILLINNGCYTIEEELHKGPYNTIPVWDYTAFARALAGPKPIFTAKVRSPLTWAPCGAPKTLDPCPLPAPWPAPSPSSLPVSASLCHMASPCGV
jgi:hypothetical protein